MNVDIKESIARRLEELGVRASPDELAELAAVYPVLLVWMGMVEELARDEEKELGD